MYTVEGVSSVANFIILMKSLNKTDTPIFCYVVCSLFPNAIFFTFILHVMWGLTFFYTNILKLCLLLFIVSKFKP